jgi:single-stranded-DNA-specific exonuclease
MRYRWHEPAGGVLPPGVDKAAIVAALLARRGYRTPTAIADFLAPTPVTLADPFLLAGMDRAVDRLGQALAGGERIAIWGDYDVDGLTSTALLDQVLRGIGCAPPHLHIPHRVREGYGLKQDGISRLAATGMTLLVAVDCGVSDRAAIAHATALGIDTIVLDHHQLPPLLPDAVAVVNPHRPDSAYPFRDLAAVGVAFTLARALDKAGFALGGVWGENELDLLDLLDLVALGTVADVVPLAEENRALVAWGLNALRHTTRPGLVALSQVAALTPERLTAWEIGHALGPRLNAAGRVAGPEPALQLLRSTSPEEALPLAQELDRLNRERQRELARIVEEAIARVEADGPLDDTRPILQLDGHGWTAGVVGLVAGRLTERYSRPTIVLERGEAFSKGSARSIDGFNLVEALAACADLLDHYGGHAKAAGLTVANENLEGLRVRLLEIATARLSADHLRPSLALDLELAAGDLTYATAEAIGTLEPFGHGNPEPLLLVRAVRPRWVKTSYDGKHLFFTLPTNGPQGRSGVRCVAFSQGVRKDELLATPGGQVDLAGALRREWWQGEERLGFHLRDFRPSAAG